MRFKRSIALLSSALVLCSCTSIPEDIRTFLYAMDASQAWSTITEATYTYGETHYEPQRDEDGEVILADDDGNVLVGEEIGGATRTLELYSGGTDYYAYTTEESYWGTAISLDSTAGFYVTYETAELSRVEDGDSETWMLTTYMSGYDDSGAEQSYTDIQTELASGNAADEVYALLIGNDTDYGITGGLWYGQFLRTDSRIYAQYMTVDESADKLTLVTPAMGIVSEKVPSWVIFELTVDNQGMLLYRKTTAYDATTELLNISEMEASYVRNTD